MKITYVLFMDKLWKRTEPPWIKGRRPVVTYTEQIKKNVKPKNLL
jgi:hypothetical protein